MESVGSDALVASTEEGGCTAVAALIWDPSMSCMSATISDVLSPVLLREKNIYIIFSDTL